MFENKKVITLLYCTVVLVWRSSSVLYFFFRMVGAAFVRACRWKPACTISFSGASICLHDKLFRWRQQILEYVLRAFQRSVCMVLRWHVFDSEQFLSIMLCRSTCKGLLDWIPANIWFQFRCPVRKKKTNLLVAHGQGKVEFELEILPQGRTLPDVVFYFHRVGYQLQLPFWIWVSK